MLALLRLATLHGLASHLLGLHCRWHRRAHRRQASLLLGSLPGIGPGSHASARVPERFLRPLLASMLVLIGGKLIAL
jgi:uncharacterized membrane protein YfcA